MSEEYKPITNLWKDSEGYRYFGTLKLSSKIKYDGDDFIPLWEWVKLLQEELEEYKNPNICFNTNEYDNFEDYCTLRETFDPFEIFYENQELKKQLEEANEKIILLQASKPMLEYKKALERNQQKEFIEYMNKTIEELECDNVDDEELRGYIIQRIDTFKEILQKYRSIIGDDK